MRKLTRRGLRGVKLVISDAHEGIKAAVSKVLSTNWQRCRVGLLKNPAVADPVEVSVVREAGRGIRADDSREGLAMQHVEAVADAKDRFGDDEAMARKKTGSSMLDNAPCIGRKLVL